MKPVDKAPGGREREDNGGEGSGQGGHGKKATEPANGGGARKCPLCGKGTRQDYRPFCSRRCADIDLSRWLKGAYAIPGVPGSVDEDETGET